jgi:RHS repeat-associated protein
MLMLWDGNRQIQEYTTDHVFTTVYEQDSFVPVARVVQLATHLEQKRLTEIAYETRRFVRIGESDVVINQRIADKSQPILKIYYYHCNHLGTPQELSDEKGDIIWLSYDRAWGGSFDTLYKPQFIDNFAISENELQPFKFQGQSLDSETGLHYNRFRYYDSDVGMFISRDPIELLGGINNFAYAPNPVMWIDPYGLAKIGDTGIHRILKKTGNGFQSHHLNQDAAYRDVIPRNDGAATLLKGNAFKDVECSHYKAHEAMEQFWDQYRIGGAKYGEIPTNLEYSKALANSLRYAGFNEQQVKENVRLATKNRNQYHLLGGQQVPRIPARINQKKRCIL